MRGSPVRGGSVVLVVVSMVTWSSAEVALADPSPSPPEQAATNSAAPSAAASPRTLREGLVQAIEGRVLGDVQGERELADEHLPRLHEHRLLACGQALVGIAQGE